MINEGANGLVFSTCALIFNERGQRQHRREQRRFYCAENSCVLCIVLRNLDLLLLDTQDLEGRINSLYGGILAAGMGVGRGGE